MCVVKWVWQWGHGQPREFLQHRQNLEEPPERNVGNNLNCILLMKNCTSTFTKRARKTFFRALATEKRGGAQPEARRRRRDLQPTGRARGSGDKKLQWRALEVGGSQKDSDRCIHVTGLAGLARTGSRWKPPWWSQLQGAWLKVWSCTPLGNPAYS